MGINLNDLYPAAPAGKTNVKWQAVSPPVALSVSSVSNSGGLFSITTSIAHGLQTNDAVMVFNLKPASLIGTWRITVMSSTAFTLQGSTYASGWVSGGTVLPDRDVSAYMPNLVGDTGSGGAAGAAPAPAAGDAAAGKFLAANGTWSVPAGSGGGGSGDPTTPSLTAPPAAATWTQVNFHAGDSISDLAGSVGVKLYAKEHGAINSPCYAYKSIPSGTGWTMIARFRPNGLFAGGSAVSYVGVMYGDGTKFAFISIINGSTPPLIRILKYNNATTYAGSDYLALTGFLGDTHLIGIKVVDDGTNRTTYLSGDGGWTYYQVHQVARTDFLTPTIVGICIDAAQTSWDASLCLFDWHLTSP